MHLEYPIIVADVDWNGLVASAVLKLRVTMCRDFAESSRFGGTRCLESSVIDGDKNPVGKAMTIYEHLTHI